MFVPRHMESLPAHLEGDGIKLYGVSATATSVSFGHYASRLAQVKRERPTIAWAETPAFAILHDGACGPYLVLCWWSNDNELFTSVSVLVDGQWRENPALYSFCLFDMEILWAERNFFIETLYHDRPDLNAYRSLYFRQTSATGTGT